MATDGTVKEIVISTGSEVEQTAVRASGWSIVK